MRVKPYYFAIYDSLDWALTAVVSALLLCGMMFYSEEDATSSSLVGRATLVVFFVVFVTLVCIIVGFVAADVAQVWREQQKGGQMMHIQAFERRAHMQLELLLQDVTSPQSEFLAGLVGEVQPATTITMASHVTSDREAFGANSEVFGADVELSSIVDAHVSRQ